MTNTLKDLDLQSTYVVIEPTQKTTLVDVTPTVFQDLEKNFGNFQNHLLVSCISFDKDWPTWEIHPEGDEIVYLLSGRAEILLEKENVIETLEVNKPSLYIIIPKNTWHTAKIHTPTTMIFITPGQNTQNRPI
ncbi:MAG: cupin [Acidobacteria bacterium]|nr:cupin [Acidobacteriota bacterium]